MQPHYQHMSCEQDDDEYGQSKQHDFGFYLLVVTAGFVIGETVIHVTFHAL
jgi:hypothetical protein